MSNSLAVATVTAALRQLLDEAKDAFPGLAVTAKPPDRARVGEAGNQLNIFLYHLGPDAALRNAEIPGHNGSPIFRPPLALTLEYMLTAFAPDDDDVQVHKLMGRAMSLLHDSSDLAPTLLAGSLPGTDLDAQPERVRITPSTLPIDELSRLWTSYQTNFRLSTAYSVSVVLIDSALAAPAPLPVLARGSGDQGVFVKPGRTPTLTRAFPNVGVGGAGLSAQLGDELVIEGSELAADDEIVLRGRDGVSHSLVPIADGSSSDRLLVALPDATQAGVATAWAAGPYAVSVVRASGVTRPDASTIDLRSNEIAVALAPAIAVSPLNTPAGDITLTVSCLPQVRQSQVVSLLLGERELKAPTLGANPGPDAPSTLTFAIGGVSPGTYVVRLRLDGVASRPVVGVATGNPLPNVFDPAQQVTVA
jgi:hypothetical protein